MAESDAVTARVLEVMGLILLSGGEVKTKADFAEALGVAPTIINRWERGEGCPTVENIVALCRGFSVSADYILLGDGDIWGGDRIGKLESRLRRLERKVFRR